MAPVCFPAAVSSVSWCRPPVQGQSGKQSRGKASEQGLGLIYVQAMADNTRNDSSR